MDSRDLSGVGWSVMFGSCLDRLPELADDSIDAVVCDPPYELGFMGKSWDSSGIAFNVDVWAECLRVLKPGGHLLAFGGSRTWHRIAVAVEDAGFEIRDSIAWLYGSGFPKSLDVSKAIDKAAGVERQVVGYDSKKTRPNKENYAKRTDKQPGHGAVEGWKDNGATVTAPATSEAQQWHGWGTALKPAFEPIIVGRKPLVGTVAANVLWWGTGGLNIDGTRIGSREASPQFRPASASGPSHGGVAFSDRAGQEASYTLGRWPSNVMLDEVTAGMVDEQAPYAGSWSKKGINPGRGVDSGSHLNFLNLPTSSNIGDGLGGASRFFYVAKASKRDRNEGLNLCRCDKLASWENEGHEATHPADTETSAQKDTAASGIPNNNGSEWNTSLSGSVTTDQSQKDTKSTTLTEISSTTILETSLPLTQSHTKDFTPDVNSETVSGGSLAKPVGSQSRLTTAIGISAEKGGLSMEDAGRVTLKLSSSQSNLGAHQCSECGGIVGGHPTVKPTDLMRQLVRLVTPPGGVVLDPFTGSGSTGKAAILEGFEFIGCELTEDYLPIIQGRIDWAVAEVARLADLEEEKLF